MPQRWYVGALDAVELSLGGRIVTVRRGDAVEVPDDLAVALEPNPEWSAEGPDAPDDPSDVAAMSTEAPDLGTMTAEDVLGWVGTDPDRAGRARALEVARSEPRRSLLRRLPKEA